MPLDKLTFADETPLPTRQGRAAVSREAVRETREAGRADGFARPTETDGAAAPKRSDSESMTKRPPLRMKRHEGEGPDEVVARRPGRPRGPKRTNLTITMPIETANHLKRLCDDEFDGAPYWEVLNWLLKEAGYPVPSDR